jgi:hypothetical protein
MHWDIVRQRLRKGLGHYMRCLLLLSLWRVVRVNAALLFFYNANLYQDKESLAIRTSY